MLRNIQQMKLSEYLKTKVIVCGLMVVSYIPVIAPNGKLPCSKYSSSTNYQAF